MKLKTVKGQWLLQDGERLIDFKDEGIVAWGYVLTMRDIRDLPKVPRQLYPVRSLVPHPKKRRVTKKWREKINRIKRNYEMGVHGE